MSGVRVIFPDWGCVRQSSLYWTTNLSFAALQKQALTFPSGKPLSGHPQDDKSFKTTTDPLEWCVTTFYYLTVYESYPSLSGNIARIPNRPRLKKKYQARVRGTQKAGVCQDISNVNNSSS
jgi:hypothetical protein